jgi:hypothetical protein
MMAQERPSRGTENPEMVAGRQHFLPSNARMVLTER